MEDAYKIRGGKKLKGEITLSGAKNVALKTIIAALLFDSPVVLEHVPRINDVFELLHLIEGLGAKAEFIEKNTLRVDSGSMNNNRVDLLHASKIRVSFMMFAPLLHRFQHCFVPNPGGCRIGARPINRIIEGMKGVGVAISYGSGTGYYEAKITGDVEGIYEFEKPTHTGTETLILLSVLSNKETTLKNCALEPEIDELIRFLNEGGARIHRDGSSIHVQGVSSLKQQRPFKIISDRNEAVTFASLAIATRGEVVLHNIHNTLVDAFIKELIRVNGGVQQIAEHSIKFFYQGQLRSSTIETNPHPGFMTDWQPNWAVLMIQAEGESVIHEKVFENRFSYVGELRKLGAKIDYIEIPVKDPYSFYHFHYHKNVYYRQAIKIFGPRRLHNAVLTIADLRAGATLAIASLVAHGDSIVHGASIIERGYEDFVQKVQNIGGEIDKI